MDYAELISLYNKKREDLKAKKEALVKEYGNDYYLSGLAGSLCDAFDKYEKCSSLTEEKEKYFSLLTEALQLSLEILEIKSDVSYKKKSFFQRKQLIHEENKDKNEKIELLKGKFAVLDEMMKG